MGDEEYIHEVLGGVIEYNQVPTAWELAVSMDDQLSWAIVKAGKNGSHLWYVLTEMVMWHYSIPTQPGVIGPFDTVQEAGTAWLLLGSPEGST